MQTKIHAEAIVSRDRFTFAEGRLAGSRFRSVWNRSVDLVMSLFQNSREGFVRHILGRITGALQRWLSLIKTAGLRGGRSIKAFLPASDVSLHTFFSLLRPLKTEHGLIRIGGATDGGYLVPNDLEGIRACFSPGVCGTVSFEKDLANRGIPSFMVDASIGALPEEHDLFRFERKFVGVFDDASHTTLAAWIDASGCDEGDLMLQMDVEGAEYGVILHAPSDVLSRFRILVIEFHALDWVFSRIGCDVLIVLFRKLLASHSIVHIHPNNASWPVRCGPYRVPPTMEFTFLRSDRIRDPQPATEFPHASDRPNTPYQRDYPLPECWFRAPPPRES
jgi:hypothetical protein